MGPKEDKDAKKDRMRERRLSLIDRRDTAEQTATSLSNDLRAVYGLKGLSMFGKRGKVSGGTAGASVTPPASFTNRMTDR